MASSEFQGDTDSGDYICINVSLAPSMKTILPWKIVNVQHDFTFEKLLCELQTPNNSIIGYALSVSSASDEPVKLAQFLVLNSPAITGGIEVMPTLLVCKTCRQFGNNIHIKISDSDASSCSSSSSITTSRPSAFSLLMEASKSASVLKQEYPQKKQPIRGDWNIYNALVSLLQKEKAYLLSSNRALGEQMLRVTGNILFMILPVASRFLHENIHIPKLFVDCLIDECGTQVDECVNSEEDRLAFLALHYNDPSRHKHVLPSISQPKLQTAASELYSFLHQPFLQTSRFSNIKCGIKDLADCLSKYVEKLNEANQRMKRAHATETQSGESVCKQIPAAYVRHVKIIKRYQSLETSLENQAPYTPIFLNDLAPADRKSRYDYVEGLSLPFACELLWCSDGNKKLWFIWRIPFMLKDRDVAKTISICKELEETHVKHYSTRLMRRKFSDKYSLFLSQRGVQLGILPAILNEMYQDLTGDASARPSKISQNVQTRLKLFMEAGDPELLVDLRQLNKGAPTQYDTFFTGVENYINKNSLEAVHERRHDEAGRLALAISVRDLIAQVASELPKDTPVPSEAYMRLQFWPKNKTHHAALHYTGRFPLKYQIQTRQIREEHMDSHYGAAVFRYLKEFAILYAGESNLVFLDDKHNIKVGEPGVPLASAERGRQCIVTREGASSFSASDHDFAKFKLVPSAALLCEIPESIEDSFYRGQLHVGVKEILFQPSSPIRHMAELFTCLKDNSCADKPVLLLYSDGGPDHRLTFLAVQVSLLCMFIEMDLDILVAARTAPHQSYRNPVERCMSTLNLGLQFVALERKEMDPDFEKRVKNLSSLKTLRNAASTSDDLKVKMISSVQPCIDTMCNVFSRLEYTGKPVSVQHGAHDDAVSQIKKQLHKIDASVDLDKGLQMKDLRKHPELAKFLDKHSLRRHYFFSIKKCAEDPCEYCKLHPSRMTPDSFASIHHLPDPMPAADAAHYKSFQDVFGTVTSEEHRPSMAAAGKATTGKRHEVQYSILSDQRGLALQGLKTYMTCLTCLFNI